MLYWWFIAVVFGLLVFGLWLLIGWVWVVCGFACCLAVAVGFVILLSVLVLVLCDVGAVFGLFYLIIRYC